VLKIQKVNGEFFQRKSNLTFKYRRSVVDLTSENFTRRCVYNNGATYSKLWHFMPEDGLLIIIKIQLVEIAAENY
jgi:hypothetical protein